MSLEFLLRFWNVLRCAQVETEISTAGVNHGACVTPEYFKLKTLSVFFSAKQWHASLATAKRSQKNLAGIGDNLFPV